jgi:hypothetical protein
MHDDPSRSFSFEDQRQEQYQDISQTETSNCEGRPFDATTHCPSAEPCPPRPITMKPSEPNWSKPNQVRTRCAGGASADDGLPDKTKSPPASTMRHSPLIPFHLSLTSVIVSEEPPPLLKTTVLQPHEPTIDIIEYALCSYSKVTIAHCFNHFTAFHQN